MGLTGHTTAAAAHAVAAAASCHRVCVSASAALNSQGRRHMGQRCSACAPSHFWMHCMQQHTPTTRSRTQQTARSRLGWRASVTVAGYGMCEVWVWFNRTAATTGGERMECHCSPQLPGQRSSTLPATVCLTADCCFDSLVMQHQRACAREDTCCLPL